MLNTELIQIRESLKLTKSELAKALGTSAMLIGRMEKGSCKISEDLEEAIKKLIASAEEEASAEEKPKRKGGRKKKAETAPAEEVPAAAEEPAVEEPAEVVAEEPAPVVAEEPAAVVEEKSKRKAGKKKGALTVTIQSAMGGSISVEEIVSRIPDGADEVYIKVEENKAYWVKGEDSGFVLLWD